MIKLEDIEQLEAFLAKNPDAFILKHSTSCSVSARAYQEYAAFAPGSPLPTAIVLVIESRPVSNQLVKLSGVAHQSPQLLFFRGGQCCNSLSHFSISAENLQVMLEEKV
jgi:bacillithiol system protein YtxJ